MPTFIIIHRHEYGTTLYEADCNFDLLAATQTYRDWPARLAACLKIDYEPQKNEEIEIAEREAAQYTTLTRDEFESATELDDEEEDEEEIEDDD